MTVAKNRRKKSMKRSKIKAVSPTLQFVPGGSHEGFTPTGLTGFQDLNPDAVVRELIQNAMDSALVDAGEDSAQILFRVRNVETSAIPGIKEYRKTFSQAVKSQRKLLGTLPDQAEAVAQSIKECLAKDSCAVLSVLDNGIGLNKKRMKGLLGDGISIKEGDATGAFGNGHVVAIPASDLRYVLYGGVTRNNQRVGSGHAILAAHESEISGKGLSNDGFLVNRLRSADFFDPYEFATGEEIPRLLAEEIEKIRKQWGHGAAIVIPGFNHFREDTTTLWNTISKAAAKNFFAAIQSDRLCIKVEENGESNVLNSDSIEDVLIGCREQKNATFISGRRAHEAWITLKKGKDFMLETEIGSAALRLRRPIEVGVTHVDLCRNGMWITNKIPMFQNQFGDRQPFHCLILLDSQSGDLHKLVRKSEGPLHNSMSLKYLKSEEKKALRSALAEIRERLKLEVPSLNTESFRPNDIFVVGTHGITQGGARPAFVGSPTVIRRRLPKEISAKGQNGVTTTPSTPKNRQRSRNPLDFRADLVETGTRSCRIEILPLEDSVGSELRLALDENLDVTCDNQSGELYMELLNARIDGTAAQAGQLVHDEQERVLGIQLGALRKGQRRIIEMDYRISADIPISQDQRIVFQIEMLRRAAGKSQQEKEA